MVNTVFTGVGGCQYQLDSGDEVVWVYDAFDTRPLLALFPAGYAGGARPLTAMAELDEPVEVGVDAYERRARGRGRSRSRRRRWRGSGRASAASGASKPGPPARR